MTVVLFISVTEADFAIEIKYTRQDAIRYTDKRIVVVYIVSKLPERLSLYDN
jgi:hypothetical protein